MTPPTGMKQLAILSIGLTLLTGCAALKKRAVEKKKKEAQQYAYGDLGLSTCFRNGVLVHQEVTRPPAKKAGIQRGDEILSFNGIPIKTPRDVTQFSGIVRRSIGKPIDIEWRSGASFQTARIVPQKILIEDHERIKLALKSILATNEDITLAVLVEEVIYNLPVQNVPEEDVDKWKQSIQMSIQSRWAQHLVDMANSISCGQFRLVERGRVMEIVDGLGITLAGAISFKAAREIGEKSGATHILFVSASRGRAGESLVDDMTYRLVETKSATVIAASSHRFYVQ